MARVQCRRPMAFGSCHVVKLNVMGEPHIHERADPQPSPDDLYTPLKWGRAYDGPAEMAYPIPQEYTFKDAHKTLEDVNVKALTKAFLAMRKTKKQKSTLRWERERRLPDLSGKWKQISQLYKYNFLTPRPRDSYMHFKHVLHRRIATANRFADDPTCRFCGIATESSTHIASCIATEPIFEFIEGLLGMNLRPRPGSEIAQRLFCYQVDKPHNRIPPRGT